MSIQAFGSVFLLRMFMGRLGVLTGVYGNFGVTLALQLFRSQEVVAEFFTG